ncbi:MAG: isocitrate/isopropylmalate family dehydrogenase, partial [Marinoscillum sp.]
GKNIANPIGSILSLAMMFEHSFNREKESNIIKQAVQHSLKEKITTQDISGNDKTYSTSDVGDFICNYINS